MESTCKSDNRYLHVRWRVDVGTLCGGSIAAGIRGDSITGWGSKPGLTPWRYGRYCCCCAIIPIAFTGLNNIGGAIRVGIIGGVGSSPGISTESAPDILFCTFLPLVISGGFSGSLLCVWLFSRSVRNEALGRGGAETGLVAMVSPMPECEACTQIFWPLILWWLWALIAFWTTSSDSQGTKQYLNEKSFSIIF